MSEPFSVAEVRKDLSKAFNRAFFFKEIIRVEKHGEPFVAVVSNEDGSNVEELRDIANSLDMPPSLLLERLRALLREESSLLNRITVPSADEKAAQEETS